jgi:CHAD domain-containing protein
MVDTGGRAMVPDTDHDAPPVARAPVKLGAERPLPRPRASSIVPGHSAAIEVIVATIAAQREELVRRSALIGIDAAPKDVHKMRVAIRRARAVLHAATPALARPWADDLRGELSWLADQLAPAREADVLFARVRPELVSLGPDAIHGRSLLTVLDRDRAFARERLHEALQSDRFGRALDAMEPVAVEPWVVDEDVTLERMAAREHRAARKRFRRMADPPTGADLHRLRIRVKRARYTAELLQATDPSGKRAERVATYLDGATSLQKVLGEHQDAVVAGAVLRRITERVTRVDAALVAGRLIEREQARCVTTLGRLRPAWKRFDRAGRAALP